MKKILLFLLIAIAINAQDVNTTFVSYFSDTLTATIDTMQLYPEAPHQYYTIAAVTTTGTDTVKVFTAARGGTFSQKALRDLSTGSPVTEITATTTVKEYLIYDPDVIAIKLITPDVSASCIVKVSGKRQYK